VKVMIGVDEAVDEAVVSRGVLELTACGVTSYFTQELLIAYSTVLQDQLQRPLKWRNGSVKNV
jgi:hypothetical protein